MNAHLKNVECVIDKRPAIKLESLTVRGARIRYVILPESLNVNSILEQQQRKFVLQQKKSKNNESSEQRPHKRGMFFTSCIYYLC